MTALTFPSIANTYPGMVYTSAGNTYVFDGVAWSLQASGAASLDPTFNTVAVTGGLTAGSISLTGVAPWVTPSALTTQLSSYATTSSVNSAISAIPAYTLPTASNSTLGGVKVDGTTITINNGVISGANTYVLPKSTTSVLGGVKVDGTTILVDANGVISGANQYVLPTATTTVKGGVIIPAVGTSGITNSSGTIGLATASPTQLGGVKVPAVANSGLSMTNGEVRLQTAGTAQLGGVKVDGVTITINGSGVISANITGAIVFQGGWSAATNTPTLSNASSAYNTNGFEFVCTASGTVNFGLGNVTFAVGDNVIYDGSKWVKIPIGSSAGTTNSLLTFDNSGSGGTTGTTFNGSSPITISYNSVGASPLIGSSSITTLGTIETGTWNGSVIGAAYGGTGVSNSYTLTVTGANRTIDQSVASGASPTFTGTNFSGTAANLTAGAATTAGTATSATTAASLSGGSANQIHVQNGLNSSTYITAPSVTDTYLKWTGTSFVWSTVAVATTATTATNLAGGAANRIHYQTATDTSGFVVAPTVSGTYLQWNGTAFVFSTVSGASGGTVTSVNGTGTVSGITLTGTVTTTGSLTLGGTLSLVSPGAIGGTTASTGRFTTIQSTVTTGTSPLIIASTTNVANLNASSLNGATFASPGAIGSSAASTGSFTTLTASTQASTTTGSGTIYLNNTTQSRIDFAAGASNFGAPTFTNISLGSKIILYPAVGSSSADYAIGIEGSTQWFGVPTTSEQFKWYAGTTNVMTLSGAGVLTASSFSGAHNGAHNGTVGATTANTGAFTTLSYTEARDTVFSGGATTGTITPNAANGNVQTITLTGNITLNALASPVSGQTLTLIIKQPATGGPRLLTSSMLFAGGVKTLSTGANAIDMLTISYIGTTYYASLVTGFA